MAYFSLEREENEGSNKEKERMVKTAEFMLRRIWSH